MRILAILEAGAVKPEEIEELFSAHQLKEEWDNFKLRYIDENWNIRNFKNATHLAKQTQITIMGREVKAKYSSTEFRSVIDA